MSQILAEAPVPRAISPSLERTPCPWHLDWAAWLVVGVAVAFAGIAYTLFLDHPRSLWGYGPHDRNYHYLTGLNFGLGLRQFDVAHLRQTIDKQRTWGVLHGMLLGTILAVTGPDFRVGILPSLAGWIGTAVFAFLAARRLCQRGGNLAGFVAALFVLTSPGHQAFATESMLESLGACLSLAVLHRYLVAVQEPSRRAWSLLGLALSLLFFLKTNYWLLTVIGLGLAELIRRPGFYLFWLKEAWHAVGWRSWLGRQLRQPLNYLLAALISLIGWIMVQDSPSINVFGREVSLSTPHNVVNLAYAVLFLRVLFWWRKYGRSWFDGMGREFLPLAYWHAIPVAVYFLLPKRLGYFLWFISPANAAHDAAMSFTRGLANYHVWIVSDYHIAPWMVLVALALVGIALLVSPSLRPGSVAVICFLLISLFLTAKHPSHMSRYVHSWLAAGWVLAGAGLATLIYGRATASCQEIRPWLAGIAMTGLACLTLPEMLHAHHVAHGGPNPDFDSSLILSDCYLPELKDSRRTLILSNAAINFFCQWTYIERYGKLHGADVDVKNFGQDPDRNRQLFDQWLARHDYDSIVFIDVPPGSYFFERPSLAAYGQVPGLLREQTQFVQARRWEFAYHGCAVTLWTRTR
ncbi:MAG: hypothetical protein FJ271_21555 [Planctomycetes bacterium]|nr:hypothetical protein [Planctomycetota bacterium]